MKTSVIATLILLILCLQSCAPVGSTPDEYGFFSGIWHGIIWPFSLIGWIFGADIGLYAHHNTGFTYWLGFIIGLGVLGGGSGQASRRN